MTNTPEGSAMTLRTITFDDSIYKLVPREPTDLMLDNAVELALLVAITKNYRWQQYMSDVWSRMIAAAPEYQEPEINLESQDFYEVMQAYRHDKGTGKDSFEAVKQWLRNPVYLYQERVTSFAMFKDNKGEWQVIQDIGKDE